MAELFKDRIESGMTKERLLVIAGSYTGNADAVTDLANAKTELDKLFNPLWFELTTSMPDQLVYTILDDAGVTDFIDTYGTIDTRIVPFVEKQSLGTGAYTLVDEDDYEVDYDLGTLTFSVALNASDVIRVTLCGNTHGAQAFDGSGKINLTNNKIMVLGQSAPAFQFIVDEGADPAFSYDVLIDIGKRHNAYPGEQALKMIYGDDWTEAAAGASGTDFSDNATWNEFKSNADPFFCAWVFIGEDTASGALGCKMEMFVHCILDEFPTTKNISNGNDAATLTIKGTATKAHHAAILNA